MPADGPRPAERRVARKFMRRQLLRRPGQPGSTVPTDLPRVAPSAAALATAALHIRAEYRYGAAQWLIALSVAR